MSVDNAFSHELKNFSFKRFTVRLSIIYSYIVLLMNPIEKIESFRLQFFQEYILRPNITKTMLRKLVFVSDLLELS